MKCDKTGKLCVFPMCKQQCKQGFEAYKQLLKKAKRAYDNKR